MTLQQLQYVVALDNYRHYVTAAEKCFVTQPTITTQVKKLEDEIGVVIFDRSTTPLVPTQMGQSVIARARRIIREVNQLQEMITSEKESIDGSFNIGIIPTLSQYLIPQFAGTFVENYPNTMLNIEEMKTESIIEAIDKNTIDIGILVTPLDEANIREIKLYNEPFVFYGSEKNIHHGKEEITPADIEHEKGLWLLNSGHCFRNQVLNICNSSDENQNIRFQSGSIESVKKMVNNYGGYTLVPEMAIDKQDEGLAIPFAEPKPIREVSIVVHQSFVKESVIDILRREILKIVPPHFEKNERFIKVKWR